MSKTENILKENGAFIRESLGVRKNGRSTPQPMACDNDPVLTDDGKLIYHQLVRYHHRVKLNPLEFANALRKAIDLHNWSANHLSRVLGISNATISRTVALLKLPESIQALVRVGAISGSAAYEITKIADAKTQAEVVSRVVSERLGQVKTVVMVKQVLAEKNTETIQPKKSVLAKPSIKTFQVPSGKLTIELRQGLSDDDLMDVAEQLVEKLRGQSSEAG